MHSALEHGSGHLESIAYLGLGANLGDPVQQLIDAKNYLSKLPNCKILNASAYYLTSPVGYQSQPDFVNCVVALETTLSAEVLLQKTQKIENLLGRTRVLGNQNAPRLIDIDILLFGDVQLNTADLSIPHPRIAERLFVLLPLSELLHNQAHRLLGSVSSLLSDNQFEGQSVFRLVM
ncbi:2-amino-4-hydroxy-6-hydroxymethyldihydropteridine diphosphokinase [Arenicella xantha]|nr:2-amino-4-hydroxy-6-hydroxymethyldihydropteridine diphosphokinase [Arenicella xantha]